ncbi:MAG: cobalamin-binding protein [Proteobacteria bacterium]|nr:cobalamin-binding protein [Pseudomonadota bacterium]MBU4009816.1 cobalamin-binding protein [Pseudomonadota bacterium]
MKFIIIDELLKNPRTVIPAKAGIRNILDLRVSGLRRNNEKWFFLTFYRIFTVAFLVCLFATSAWSGTRTVIDQVGRSVTIPSNPQRIVALAPSITEIVFALGQEHRLKGVTQFSDFPAEAEKIAIVGSYVNLDLEKIVALKPDLCIAIKDGNSRNTVQQLESLNIPVYAVNPKNIESVMETVVEIGKLLGVHEKAKSLVDNMYARTERVNALVLKTKYRPRVFFQIGIAPIVSVGAHTFIHELITRAGGQNLTEGPIPYPRYSREQVLGMAPEVFIITSMARGEIFEKVKADWSRWKDLPAVKNNRIYLVDSNILDRPTPRLVDGLEMLVKIIHPELFDKH